MAYGVGWGGSPWGGSLSADEVVPVFYDITVDETPIVLTVDVFVGVQQIPAFIVGAQSPTKVEVVFSVAMSIDSNFTNPARYTLRATEAGTVIPITSVTVSGTAPLRRATLHLGASLESKEYYSLVVAPSIVSLTGDPSDPDIYIFQWSDMTTPVFVAPLEIPIRDFSGEVTGGLLGNPDGQVFFTPAYETVGGDSTIELESVSVCTRAYDEYHIPDPPDPIPLLTWAPGVTTVSGSSSVLWAPADRLGLPSITLALLPEDIVQPANDFAVEALLVEPIDITKAGFLNDARWKTFPATGATVFRTASNLTFIGPGPTTPVNLDWPKIVLSDNFPITDQVVVNILDVETATDSISVVDGLTIQNITVGTISITIDEALSISDGATPSTQYSKVLATDAVAVSDSVSRSRDIFRTLSDTVSVTDAVTIVAGVTYDVVATDTLDTTDQTLLSLVYNSTASDSVTTTDSNALSLVYAKTLSDAISTADQVDAVKQGDLILDDTLDVTDSTVVQPYYLYSLSLSDDITVTDSNSRTLEAQATGSDTVSTTDSTANSLEYGRTLSDTDALTDSTASSLDYARTGSDTIDITEFISATISANGDIDVNDTITVTDSNSILVDTTLAVDTIVITESKSIEVSKGVSDTAAITDLVWTEGAVQYHDTTHSPAGLWQFNETLNDTSGNGQTLTVETGAVTYGEIFPGVQGVILDGSTALLYNTAADATLGTTGDMTVEMLLVLSAYTTSKTLVSYNGTTGSSNTNSRFSIDILNNIGGMTWAQEISTNVQSRTSDITTRPTLNQLCHFAMTRRSNVIRTYIDGVLVDTSATLSTPTGGSSSRFRVGSVSGRGLAPLCAMASLKVITSGLTDSQVAAEYNRTLGRFYGEI